MPHTVPRPGTAKPRPYSIAGDGLPARQVGPWVERKVQYVDYYAGMFATGMRHKWQRRAYVELFAGTGPSWDYGHCREIEGSALWALRRDSIAQLVEGRTVDLLLTFHHGAMRRVRDAPPLARLMRSRCPPSRSAT